MVAYWMYKNAYGLVEKGSVSEAHILIEKFSSVDSVSLRPQ